MRRALLFTAALCALPVPDAPAQEPLPPPEPEERPEAARPPRAADDDLGETVVSARKWTEELQDVPMSVSVIDGETLQRAGIDTVEQASQLVPNFVMTEFTARRLSFPFVRGVGSGQGEPSVTTFVDGVPQLSTGSANLPLVGLERVEFLRGPQSTLYGRNTLAGAISLVSRRPGPTAEIDASATFGNLSLQEYLLAFHGPLGGGVGLGLDLFQSQRDGFTTNQFTGDDVNSRDAFFGRANLFFEPSRDSRLRVGLYGQRARDGGFALGDLNGTFQPLTGLPGLRQDPFTINQDFQGVTERDVIAPNATFEHFGGSVDFTSITSFTAWDVLETSDFDFTPIDGVRRRTEEDQQFVYQELRLSSAEGEELELSDTWEMRWVAGVSGFWADTSRTEANDFRPGGAGILFPVENVGTATNAGEFDDLAGAAFGQLTFTANEKLELGAGLRYDYESKEAGLNNRFDSGGFTFVDTTTDEDEDFDALLPRFSAAYHVSDETMVYGLAAKGFKAGGFNLAAPGGETTFDEETSWTYEAGVRQSFLDGRIRASAALFYIDWEDMQLSLFDQQAGGYVTNAGQSTSRGFELEAAAEVVDGVDVFGSFGYTDTEFDQFVDPYGQDAAGNDLPFAPETTWSVGLDWRGSLSERAGLLLRAEYNGVGTFYYDAGNRESESYELVNLRGGLSWGRLVFELWVRNLFDQEYIPIAFQPNPADPTVFVGENGLPRTYGFTLRASF